MQRSRWSLAILAGFLILRSIHLLGCHFTGLGFTIALLWGLLCTDLQSSHIGIQVWLRRKSVESIHDHTRSHASAPTPLVCGNYSEVELQGISKRSDSFGTASVLRHANSIPPGRHVMSDPSRNQGFCM